LGKAHAGRIAGVAALAIPLLPKCPVCAPPFLAAAGIALPRGPAVEALVAAAVAGWLAVVLATARWKPVRLAAVAGSAALLLGRLLEIGPLAVAGSALMFAVAPWIAARPRRCHAPSETSSPA
jgi:hypothetical protein